MENCQKRKLNVINCGPCSTRQLKILCSIIKITYAVIDNFKYAKKWKEKISAVIHQLETIIFKILIFKTVICVCVCVCVRERNYLFQWLHNIPCSLFKHSITTCWPFSFAIIKLGFPHGSVVKNLPTFQETRVQSWIRKIPWRREWQPTPVFLPGE